MRHLFIIVLAVLGTAGCTTHPTKVEWVAFPKDQLAAVYSDLKPSPIPLPQVTPFDKDSRQRDAFFTGFRDGWDWAISGNILFGLRSQPCDLPADLFAAWSGGWHEGTTLGGQKLLEKLP